MAGSEKDLKIEYLPDDGGVKVNGEWFSSLAAYFEDREDSIKGKEDK